MKVRCLDCENYQYQEYCFMENCIWHPDGYCVPCPCNHCDVDCTTPEKAKDISVRPKYVKKVDE